MLPPDRPKVAIFRLPEVQAIGMLKLVAVLWNVGASPVVCHLFLRRMRH